MARTPHEMNRVAHGMNSLITRGTGRITRATPTAIRMRRPLGSAITVAVEMDPLVTDEDRVLRGMKVFVRGSDLTLLSSKPSVRKVVPAAREMNRVVYPEKRVRDPMDPLVKPGAVLVARMSASLGSVVEVASERDESFPSMDKAASEMSSRMC
jgi:hypothetical protein